jgi:hypothetical protein
MVKVSLIGKYRVFFLLAVMLISALSASPACPPEEKNADAVKEKIVLFSDRALYITGERVYFSAFLVDGSESGTHGDSGELSPAGSRVLYAEIISPEGKAIVQGKFPLNSDHFEGHLLIPSETITGVYYLRAYTRIMRNTGPESYAYLGMRIVNPFKAEVMRGNDTVISPAAKDHDILPMAVSISPDKAVYKTGDNVTVSINITDSTFLPRMANISVVPHLTYHRQEPLITAVNGSTGLVNTVDERLCRETRGLSISGILTASGKSMPLAGRRVNLSVIGHGKDFMAMNTDEEGRFFFSLPDLTGWRDLYLGATGEADEPVRILADNDFCNKPVQLPSPEFKLTGAERELALRMSVNELVRATYRDSVKTNKTVSARPFYGTPDQVLVLSDFVQLPTLEEYFNELAGLVKIRVSNGRKYFKVTGLQPEMSIYEPLVMIDHVAVDDPEKVLSAAPSSIDRIEMINQPYLKGDILFGGVVSIISKQGDFAGIDLPASGTFINYRFFNEPETPDYSPGTSSPDARNTVFYGVIPTSVEGKYTPATFTTPATPGIYQIVVSTVDKSGDVRVDMREIEVR